MQPKEGHLRIKHHLFEGTYSKCLLLEGIYEPRFWHVGIPEFRMQSKALKTPSDNNDKSWASANE